MEYRRRFDIIADILQVVKGNNGAKKTQIMYGANLSYEVLTKYLKRVLEAKLVEFENKRECYILTAKGKEFLQQYRDYNKRNRRLESALKNLDVKRRVLEEYCQR
ncbi:MAG: winged helix-turn-helix domain-containing protein [Candidatus Bathyarchaeia archaeon]